MPLVRTSSWEHIEISAQKLFDSTSKLQAERAKARDLDDLKTEHHREYHSLQREVTRLLELNEAKTAECEKLEECNSTLSGKVEALRKELEEQRNLVHFLQKQNEELSTVQQRLGEERKHHKEQETKLKSLAEQLEAEKKQNKEKEGNIGSLQKDIAKEKEKAQALQREQETMQRDMDNLKVQASKYGDTVVGTPQWWYQDDSGVFQRMAPDVNLRLVEAKKDQEKDVQVQVGKQSLTMDIVNLTQTNNSSKNERPIKVSFNTPEHWSLSPENQWKRFFSSSSHGGVPQNVKCPTGQLLERSDMIQSIKQLLANTVDHVTNAPANGMSGCNHMERVKVHNVYQVLNEHLWEQYSAFLRGMTRTHRENRITPNPLPNDFPRTKAAFANFHHKLEEASAGGIQEHLLFHGTTAETKDKIVRQGFDFRVAGDGYYGRGTYFASQSCKSLQYSKTPNNGRKDIRTMLLCRVALGDPHFTTTRERTSNRPPLHPCGHGTYDCVIAKGGEMMSGYDPGLQTHDEFVIFERCQAYPEFVIEFSLA